MSELNKKLSALSRQQGQGQESAISRSEIKPATIKPVKQTNLTPWATFGVLSLGIVIGIGGWQLWTSNDPVGEVVMAVNPVAPVEAAPAALVAEVPVVAEKPAAQPDLAQVESTSTVEAVPKAAAKPAPAQPPKEAPVPVVKTKALKAEVSKTVSPKPVASKSETPKPKAPKPKAPEPVVTQPVTGKPAMPEPAVSSSADGETHQIDGVDMMDGDESLMIETVELDAGQLAQIEYSKAEKALKQGDSRKAIGYLESAIKYQPEWITARQKLAALHYGRGDTRRAIATLQKGLSLDANQADLRLTMAKLLVNESQQQAALNVLSQLPSNTHSGYLAMRGALAQQLNQNELALSSYQSLVKAEPYDGRWWLGLGVALERGQDRDQAEEAYQQALRMGQISDETQQFIRQRLAVLASMKG
ncbi:tetratricopeptide repeat protein [Photobacterium sp. DNB23_23_1]